MFIDDGSSDGTLQAIKALARKYKYVRFVSFSRNFGKEAALYAGLQASTGELITVMDVDLQDPPELLPLMIEKITTTDIDCVGTRRSTREGEPVIRSFFAKRFYQLINKISDTEMVDGARDFRLMTRQMVDAVLELTEYNRFQKDYLVGSVSKQSIFLLKTVNEWLVKPLGPFGNYSIIRLMESSIFRCTTNDRLFHWRSFLYWFGNCYFIYHCTSLIIW